MIGILQTHVCKQPIIALYFEFETVFKFYNLKAWIQFFWHSEFMKYFLNWLKKHKQQKAYKIKYHLSVPWRWSLEINQFCVK